MNKKNSFLLLTVLLTAFLYSCNEEKKDIRSTSPTIEKPAYDQLAEEVKSETLRSWQSYKKHAWGHDVLKPLSSSFQDWYSEPLYISPIDAYSTLHLMGLNEEALEIEKYVVDSLDFDKDVYAKIFEVNIRILGGLLAMYDLSKNETVLEKARDFADRMLPAFDTKTGIPKYWVNLKTGEAKGDTVNVAEAASYTMEMGVLSYYTGDPKYYQAAKMATKAIYQRRSEIGLIGDVIDVETGDWVSTQSHICAGVDSYYEYLYKSYVLFGDEDLKVIWDESIGPLHKYLPVEKEGNTWYGRSNMYDGKHLSAVVTLYDAFFPAVLCLAGDIERAKIIHKSWEWLWDQNDLEPMVYDFDKKSLNYPVYDLNPEIIESAYYLLHFTGEDSYLKMNEKFWSDIKTHCKNDLAFHSVENVVTKEKRDYMPTFFFAETLKYLYLTFSHHKKTFDLDEYVFNTEAHQFKKKHFDKDETKNKLGF